MSQHVVHTSETQTWGSRTQGLDETANAGGKRFVTEFIQIVQMIHTRHHWSSRHFARAHVCSDKPIIIIRAYVRVFGYCRRDYPHTNTHVHAHTVYTIHSTMNHITCWYAVVWCELRDQFVHKQRTHAHASTAQRPTHADEDNSFFITVHATRVRCANSPCLKRLNAH